MITVLVPHVGGPILPPCAITVLTGSMPQARVMDLCVCVGPPDMIAMGAFTVLVSGMPAARMLDMTIHGGVIMFGLPTVLIGDNGAGAGSGGAGAAGGAAAPVHDSGKGGSTTVAVDKDAKTITIKTNIEYTGPGATQAYADAAKKNIEDMWGGTTMRDGVEYTVKVEVTTKVNPSGPPTPGYDPIDVDPAYTRENQTLFGAGKGEQRPATVTDPNAPHVAAHEYGHTLGLPDEYHDTPTGSQPNDPTKKNNIMAETWNDATGKPPHPHQDHYDQILKNYGF